MATPVVMPNVGITVESCVLTAWHKQAGDQVKTGDPLFTYETDKTTLEAEAPCDGTVLALFFEEDADIPVMTTVCVIGREGEDFSAFAPAAPAAAQTAPAAQPTAQQNAAPAAKSAQPSAFAGEDLRISPRARQLAARLGIDAQYATPTGPEGRVIERDIYALQQTGPAPTQAAAAAFAGEGGSGIGGRFRVQDIAQAPEAALPVGNYNDERMPLIRRTIAKQMLSSLQTTAQLTHTLSFDATAILALRKRIKTEGEALGLGNSSLGDMVVFAVSRLLADPTHKALNAHLLPGDVLRTFENTHVGVAVDTPRGLMVPTLFDANEKTLAELSAETKTLAALCRNGEALPEQLAGGTFTVSNLGAFGIEQFTPVLNAPQTGILGVNTLTTQVRVVDGVLVPYQAMGLSLTYNHCALDGAPASRFLADLKAALEDFCTFAQIPAEG